MPTEESVKLALRTQQMIAYESKIPGVIDPLAGSYYVESLTNRIEEQVNDYLDKIDSMGGALAAIENGYFQEEIHRSAYEYQKAIEQDDISVIGVNKFVSSDKGKKFTTMRVSPKTLKKQLQRIKRVKARRNSAKVKSLLKKLEGLAIDNENLMEPILACVKAYATIGEISDTLRDVHGEYKEKSLF
jgi:methylmalonyl-CoA mutase N-terminal domain/subunit